MKDIIIHTRRQKTEIITLLACFLIANLVNLYAILTHDAPLDELYTSMGYVLVATLVLYLAWTLLRLLGHALTRIIPRK